ncbi:hypothetical protein [Xenorhabdus sp. PB30.3]|uniref:hypothetical protein n=1 Tax=Xenorhabdus sp. PB30.3 TaxID=2788941 RepID=UPI001E3CAF3A|nr:hypothetical protein [Xenorhabdus sp. PB30.3]MCC8381843.1 hypothetical protein [Xenorhabdus sp. PB30.3]
MTKRTRSDSLKGKMQAMVNAFQDTIEPPAHAGLMPEAIDFYNDNMAMAGLNSLIPMTICVMRPTRVTPVHGVARLP